VSRGTNHGNLTDQKEAAIGENNILGGAALVYLGTTKKGGLRKRGNWSKAVLMVADF